ncbi:hypothetical protein [Sulfuricurvum sp.]|uniref:hypothetical protein n=1 Tax=Sulfuricurvum sp. TaxID=2025608 RepID=UPI0026256EAF|nr:hypothetical protein [Sulfuricurvum sp.]MDD3597444.1 hypothetical protein [Sulfuricurvum sp.]
MASHYILGNEKISLAEFAERVETEINSGSTAQIVMTFVNNGKEALLREIVPFFKAHGNKSGVLSVLDQTIPSEIYY